MLTHCVGPQGSNSHEFKVLGQVGQESPLLPGLWSTRRYVQLHSVWFQDSMNPRFFIVLCSVSFRSRRRLCCQICCHKRLVTQISLESHFRDRGSWFSDLSHRYIACAASCAVDVRSHMWNIKFRRMQAPYVTGRVTLPSAVHADDAPFPCVCAAGGCPFRTTRNEALCEPDESCASIGSTTGPGRLRGDHTDYARWFRASVRHHYLLPLRLWRPPEHCRRVGLQRLLGHSRRVLRNRAALLRLCCRGKRSGGWSA
jgi:hypothetical protein